MKKLDFNDFKAIVRAELMLIGKQIIELPKIADIKECYDSNLSISETILKLTNNEHDKN